MNKRLSLIVIVFALCLGLFGCQAIAYNPLENAEATMVPGVEATVHSPVAGEGNSDTYTVELYFRFLTEPMLASESRKITVRQDESLEKALVNALLAGPSAASPELRRIFSDQVQVVSTLSQNNVLFVTFSESVLNSYGDEPSAWQQDTYWRQEVPLRRQLAMQSLAATLIENCGYEAVQVLVDHRSDGSTSMRLPMSYYKAGEEGLSPLIYREESYLLTPRNTADTILSYWRQKDWVRLYYYLAVNNPDTGSTRPGETQAYERMDGGVTLSSYSVGGDSVNQGGNQAVLSISGVLEKSAMEIQTVKHYPLRLHRENGIWKMTFEDLMALMERW